MTVRPRPSNPDGSISTASFNRPVKIHVASRDAGGTLRTDVLDDTAALRVAEKRQIDLRRRSERWADKLMEETVSLGAFRNALCYLVPSQYIEITHERHLNSLCAYPPCPNTPARPWNPQRKFAISRRSRDVRPVEGNPEDGWCSLICRRRSDFVLGNLSEEGVWLRSKIVRVGLLEDLSASLTSAPSSSLSNITSSQSARPPNSSSLMREIRDASTSNVLQNGVDMARDRVRSTTTSARMAVLRPKSSENAHVTKPGKATTTREERGQNVLLDIDSLTIHERPPPSVPAAASTPKPSARPNLQKRSPPITTAITLSGETHPRAIVFHGTEKAPRDSRRETSLVPPSTSLGTTVLSLSSNMGPRQLPPESDVEESSEEEEWAREMGWGEGSEFDELFEQARKARELTEDEGS
ncbi:hypothetical protein TREMEDRAFT_62082 [Tremella mesenterica DSM 1558]|uniref:uncharacterized protein n=1 Tax=Tremella mesenterica (strain ATCC 24925 / CBS 8224 / DSM 1558 / NBRC 9311 / NRRL Y-6157 / RJB 2259-6 / UBC 559-6) TaxID=578456 RepID=UPI0003F49244|nr:uncharacterized protein TREMEDRAFT_62082 [Tremella mesenterica DSM 1558]EIW70316.1 hypothetical protein TREMEDRAFT_62082 [Tremella mesenterica DSM 1558]